VKIHACTHPRALSKVDIIIIIMFKKYILPLANDIYKRNWSTLKSLNNYFVTFFGFPFHIRTCIWLCVGGIRFTLYLAITASGPFLILSPHSFAWCQPPVTCELILFTVIYLNKWEHGSMVFSNISNIKSLCFVQYGLLSNQNL